MKKTVNKKEKGFTTTSEKQNKNGFLFSSRAVGGNSQSGFTLIETLVAIFILVIAVTGPMSAAQNSLKASFLARDQVVAYYLAQDAIEGIKNLRDESVLSTPSSDWRNVGGIDTTCINPEPSSGLEFRQCNFDSEYNETWYYCGSNVDVACPPMQIDSDDIFYFDGNSGNDSKYTRAIYLYETTNPNETEVNIVIEWRTSLFLTERRIEVQENVFNWLPTS